MNSTRKSRGPERLGPSEVLARLLQTFAQQETTKYCSNCAAPVRAVRPGTSRLRQLGLTIFTLGLWSVVWLVDAVRRPGWRCSQCDQRLD